MPRAASPSRTPDLPDEECFLSMLPTIEQQARYAFRGLPDELRQERLQQVRAHAWSMFLRLEELGKAELAYASPLAQYAIGQVRGGRQPGTSCNSRDIMSRACRQENGFEVRSLNRWDGPSQEWRQIAVQDERSSPAETAAFRLDFSAWLQTLSPRDRRLALRLARGESTGVVARMFEISAGRVSQLRREMARSWRAFHRELPSPGAAPALA